MAEFVVPIRLTLDDLDAIATAVAAKLQQNFSQLSQELQSMSQTVSQQLSDLASSLDTDVTSVRADIEALASREATPEDIANLQAKVAAIHGAVGQLNDLANPPAPPAPTP